MLITVLVDHEKFMVQVQFQGKYYAPQVQLYRGLDQWPPDHEQYISCPWDAIVLNHLASHYSIDSQCNKYLHTGAMMTD